ncbi:RsfA family transcriptional regulator [Bacillus sp. Au-Bac7]|uniref:RsfA family transcriptional regulator n=1 Tax=Bacillus sp. Au-Bac7 TaxID=2906458 RepID=UPI001E314912|nr:RsfA family transcriptional regulator [Bacillus sp. Au-Bac7]MCE4051702.1 RsfA family transcriptional regulator [Bacillus sp. Au-Bac7]
MFTRQDAWTEDEDRVLADTVIRFIKDGGTQLQAFEEVGKQLSRTSSACGFRWNSFVRKQYQPSIVSAKAFRKQLKKDAKVQENEIEIPGQEKVLFKSDLDFEQVLKYVKEIYSKAKQNEDQEELLVNLKALRDENDRLQNELATIEEAYCSIVALIEKAREMVLTK